MAQAVINGQLKVVVMEAKDLPNKEMMGGKNDPYCKIWIKNEKFKTQVIKNGGQNVVWNEAFIFNLKGANGNDILHAHVYDKDFTKSDSIGRVDVKLHDILLRRNNDQIKLMLVDEDNFKKMCGTLHIKVEFTGTGAPEAERKTAAPVAAAMPEAQPVHHAGAAPVAVGAVAGVAGAYAMAAQPYMQPGMQKPQYMQPGMQQPGMQPQMYMQPGVAGQPHMAGQPTMAQPYAGQPGYAPQPYAQHPQHAAQPGYPGAYVQEQQPAPVVQQQPPAQVVGPFRMGQAVYLQACSGKNLRIMPDGSVNGMGAQGALAQFFVRAANPANMQISLQNAQGKWLRITPQGVLDGNGTQGGPYTFFQVTAKPNNQVSLAATNGAPGFVGILPDGTPKAPASTGPGPHGTFTVTY